jgi:serine/threonine protein kinase
MEPSRAARIGAEAAIACSLTHPNIVSTYAHEIKNLFTASRTHELAAYKLYLVQELCGGGTLRRMIDQGGFRGFACDSRPGERWARTSYSLRSIARGMVYVHSKSVIHGDLNPSNVLLKVLPASRVPAWTLTACRVH